MKFEIKKAITNKVFITICVLGLLISVLHCFQVLIPYNNFFMEREKIINASEIQYNPLAETTSAFTMWIGFDRTNLIAKIFFVLLPILSISSYCWSHCSDIKNGCAEKTISQIGTYKYNLNKYISIFVSSGLSIAIPLIINFMIIILFVPAIKPDSVYDIYYGIFSNNFMADTFYNFPVVYVLSFVLVNFAFCGLFGCVAYTFSVLLKNRIISISTPIVILLIVEVINRQIIRNNPTFKIIFSPLSFLCPFKSFETNWIVISSELLLIFMITFYISVFRFKTYDFKHIKRNNYEN